MRRSRLFNILIVFVLGFGSLLAPAAAYAAPPHTTGPHTYTVLVGAERVSSGIDVMAFFPDTLRIHVGDTVVWKQNSHEIHTVTFLAGTPLPELLVPAPIGGLMINPQAAFPTAPANGQYDGSTYANSGVMSTDPGQPTEFSLTFTHTGTYSYICIVHGAMMSATIEVVDSSVPVQSPALVSKLAKHDIRSRIVEGIHLQRVAKSQVPAVQKNPDGSKTYTVLIGYSRGQIDLMGFFPGQLIVRPGDTVNFTLSNTNEAPHTVTFLNGGPDIPFITPVPDPSNPSGPPLLLINPDVLAPINPGQPLTTSGVFSSGLLAPGGPDTYSLTIGNISGTIPYECLLHDTSGMTGVIKVVSK
jgi:plastocyanin